jgi:protein unc-45
MRAQRLHDTLLETETDESSFKAVSTSQAKGGQGSDSRVQLASTSIEDLSARFTTLLIEDPHHSTQISIEGLAYASLQPQVKEELSKNKAFLRALVKTLESSPPKSPLTYGALSILLNLTRYQPTQTEEEKKMSQLKAYANAAGKLEANPLDDNEHAAQRCKRVFEAHITPVLVQHAKTGSVASLSIIVSILSYLSLTTSIHGQLAQRGAVRLLIAAWTALPTKEAQARNTAAQALARILISTDPALVFGGTRPTPQSAAIRPLVSIIKPDPDADTRDLLPTFESLMALTNLASTDDDTRRTIVRTAWTEVEEQLLSSNDLVTKAAVELVCNLVEAPEGVALYADGSPQARNRLNILVALADAEDQATRSAAGGALAALTAHENVVRAIVERDRGVEIVLGLCADESEDLRHRGAFVVYNMVSCEGEAGNLAREKFKAQNGVAILTECAKKSRRSVVLEVTVQALKVLLEQA